MGLVHLPCPQLPRLVYCNLTLPFLRSPPCPIPSLGLDYHLRLVPPAQPSHPTSWQSSVSPTACVSLISALFPQPLGHQQNTHLCHQENAVALPTQIYPPRCLQKELVYIYLNKVLFEGSFIFTEKLHG